MDHAVLPKNRDRLLTRATSLFSGSAARYWRSAHSALIARVFYREAPLPECRIVIRFQLLHSLFGSFHRSGR